MASNEIDPRFFLPPGVVDLSYSDDTLSSSEVPDEEDQEFQIDSADADGEEYIFSDENALYPPSDITIISQTVRVNSGGAVVDIVIDVEAVGASQFDVRLTK